MPEKMLDTKKLRVDHALRVSGKSRTDLANYLDISRGSVSDMLNKEGDLDSLKYLEATCVLTGFRFHWLRTGEGPERDTFYEDLKAAMPEHFSESPSEYLNGDKIRTIAVTVDKSGKELMTFVPVRAQAGYMKGYGDPQFIESLPAFSLPTFTEGSYRMFQVDGNSMLQLGGGGLHDGDIVISQYLEDFFSIRDNRVYVIVCAEGVVVKRCLNRLKTEEQVLILKSDNKNGQYPDWVLPAREILEVWELKAFISRQLSFSTDLWEVISALQAEQAIMKEKLKAIGDEPPKNKPLPRAR